MAFVHGKSSTFSIDSKAGTPTDISAYVNKIDFKPTGDTSEVSSFSDTSKKYVAGLKDCQISLDVSWDATVDAILFDLVGEAEGDFDYSPDGTIHYTGKCICTSYSPASAANDAVKGSASFQVSGDVGRA